VAQDAVSDRSGVVAESPGGTAVDPQLIERIKGRGWFHTIDLGGGLVTPGEPPNEVLERREAFPDVRGRTVLDIGAWDGKYSFWAEQAGAARVVALDHYVWRTNFGQRQAYWDACEAAGRFPDPSYDGCLEPVLTPGKDGFDLAKEALGSRVEAVVDDFMTMDLTTLGRFDVVLFLGVLYHLVNPLGALQRLVSLTTEVAVIETEAVLIPGHPDRTLLALYPGKELNGDHTNWFAPTEAALHAMCLSAGFGRVETRVLPPLTKPAWWRRYRSRLSRELAAPVSYRIVVHAFP
jgi:tRNA (mo5U34)-methyltransferase